MTSPTDIVARLVASDTSVATAESLTGGRRAADPARGWFVEPTAVLAPHNGARVCREEIFGRVTAVQRFSDEADAVQRANATRYGLQAGLWTANLGRAHRVAAAIEAGMCFVNSQNVRDLRQPFGGTKASGTGREGGTWSYEVFLEPKNVAVSLGGHHIPHWGA